MSRLLVALQFALAAVVLVPREGMAIAPAGVLLVSLGVALGAWALGANRPGNFNIRPDVKPGAMLVTRGPYRYIRHPMYAALVLLGTGCVLCDPVYWRIVALFALAGVVHAKALREERAMRVAHGGYADYCAHTGRYLPRLR